MYIRLPHDHIHKKLASQSFAQPYGQNILGIFLMHLSKEDFIPTSCCLRQKVSKGSHKSWPSLKWRVLVQNYVLSCIHPEKRGIILSNWAKCWKHHFLFCRIFCMPPLCIDFHRITKHLWLMNKYVILHSQRSSYKVNKNIDLAFDKIEVRFPLSSPKNPICYHLRTSLARYVGIVVHVSQAFQ